MILMSKKLFLGLIIAMLLLRPLAAQVAFADVQYWIGSGTDSTLLIIDFQDGSADSSYVWGYAYSGNQDGEDLLTAVAAVDENLQLNLSGGFLNDVVYGQHAGIGGQPDYWSTWSGSDTASLGMNSGLATPLVNGEWFALSYTDFNPAAVPGLPIPAFDPRSFTFNDVQTWYGSGTDSMTLFIDFQLPGDSARLVFGYLFTDSVLASQILSDLDQNVAGLSVNAQSFLNDIIYHNWSGIGGGPNYWSTWSGTNVGNWYMNAGIGTYVKDGELFGCSYTDFAPALRPQVPLGLRAIGLETIAAPQIALFPNPTAGRSVLQMEGRHQLKIYNAAGVLKQSTSFEDEMEINLEGLAAGLYLLQIDQYSSRLLLQ